MLMGQLSSGMLLQVSILDIICCVIESLLLYNLYQNLIWNLEAMHLIPIYQMCAFRIFNRLKIFFRILSKSRRVLNRSTRILQNFFKSSFPKSERRRGNMFQINKFVEYKHMLKFILKLSHKIYVVFLKYIFFYYITTILYMYI